MNSKNLIRFASIEEHKESQIGKDENLELRPECCIYRVPKELRRVNEEAYTPKVISIGPLHHGNQEFAYMEKQKIRCKREFSTRISPAIWEELAAFIQENEQRIRNSYEEITSSDLQTDLQNQLEFVTMILHDSIFIFIFIFIMIPETSASLLLISYAFFDINLPIDSSPHILVPGDEVEIKHFTDLKRRVLIMTNISEPPQPTSTPDIPCALKLHESGVKFKKVKRGGLLDIKYEKTKLRNIIPFLWLKSHQLHIPKVRIYDGTESLLRNLMALEQCHYPQETDICNYIYLMDSLINSEEDVNLLADAGIISSHVGDNVKVAKMFNNICLHISLGNNCYGDVFKKLKAHYENPWNHVVATLKRVYFNNLWRGTATFAAILLLILTFIQTVCSILQVV